MNEGMGGGEKPSQQCAHRFNLFGNEESPHQMEKKGATEVFDNEHTHALESTGLEKGKRAKRKCMIPKVGSLGGS